MDKNWGVSNNARVVPAIEARIVPRIVCGRVNLYKADAFALREDRPFPDWMLAMLVWIWSALKSPSTAMDIAVGDDDVGKVGNGDAFLWIALN